MTVHDMGNMSPHAYFFTILSWLLLPGSTQAAPELHGALGHNTTDVLFVEPMAILRGELGVTGSTLRVYP
jgi:hypothetical protein